MDKNVSNKDLLIPVSLVSLTILVGGVLSLPSVGATAGTTHLSTATVTVPVACSLIGVTDSAHSATIPNGLDSRGMTDYASGIGQTTLKAYCNDADGFSIYAVGFSDNTVGNTYLRDSSLDQSDNIVTGTTFSGNVSNWAMKLGVTSGTYAPIIVGSTDDTERQSGTTDYSTWASVPSSYSRVAYRNSTTDVDADVLANGASMTTTYSAYISSIQKAGTYVGRVKYTLLHPADNIPIQPIDTPSGYVGYYPNANSVVGTMMGSSGNPEQTIGASDTSAKLLASNYSRDGYGFAGWNTAYDYSGTFYGPNDIVTFDAGTYTGSNKGLSLYAVWVESEGSIQNNAAATCNSLTTAPTNAAATLSSVSALTDERDGQTYAIAKLADGNCWMIENLRLDAEGTQGETNKALSQGFGASASNGNFVGLANAEYDNFSEVTTENSIYYSGTATGAATQNVGTSDTPSARIPRYSNANTKYRFQSYSNNSYGNTNFYGYGNYYNYAAAVANTYPYSGQFTPMYTSICPKNWRLPSAGRTQSGNLADYYLLVKAVMGGNDPNNNNSSGMGTYTSALTNANGDPAYIALRRFPYNYVNAGALDGSSYVNRGSYSAYLSATQSDVAWLWYFSMSDSSVSAGNYNWTKYAGRPVRCLLNTGS